MDLEVKTVTDLNPKESLKLYFKAKAGGDEAQWKAEYKKDARRSVLGTKKELRSGSTLEQICSRLG